MGKGLSDMQKFALRLAYENKQRGARYTAGGQQYPQVQLWEFKAKWYGWPYKDSPYTSLHFDTRRIGEKEYQAGKAATGRMITRLVERGLVRRTPVYGFMGWGYELTEEGEEVARELIG